jgi:YfiH family protein
MKKKSSNGLSWLTFDLLDRYPELVHGMFLRHGGVSPAPYHSLNVGLSTGDIKPNVAHNQSLIQEALGIETLVWLKQVHGKNVVYVNETAAGSLGEADVLFTSRPDVGLMIKVADCQSVLLYDPEAGIIANIHCGWRGSKADVIGASMEFMKREAGIEPRRMVAAVGPSLGPCCAEYRDYKEMFPAEWEKYRVGEARFDFWALTMDQLEKAGLPPDRVEMARICTRCHRADFFSYRGEIVTGRCASVIALASPRM